MSEDASKELQNERGNETSTLEENPGILSDPSTSEALESSQNTFEMSLKENELFEWIENKIELLKILGNAESEINSTNKNYKGYSKEDRNETLEEMLDEIQKIKSKESSEPTNRLSEELTKMLDMLLESTMELLDNINISGKRYRSIKVLATLIQHLSASVGTNVTIEDIHKHINVRRVLDLYSEAQTSREPVLVKMVTAKKYIEQGIKRTRQIVRKCKMHKYQVDDLFSEYSTSADLQKVNENLKMVTKESEDLLIKYSDSIGCLAEKTKTFFSLKQESEKLLSSFMTKEIPDLYKTQV